MKKEQLAACLDAMRANADQSSACKGKGSSTATQLQNENIGSGQSGIDAKERIKDLTAALKDPAQSHQYENYRAALKLYKAGKTPPSGGWFFMKGKMCPDLPKLSEMPDGVALHIEVCSIVSPSTRLG